HRKERLDHEAIEADKAKADGQERHRAPFVARIPGGLGVGHGGFLIIVSTDDSAPEQSTPRPAVSVLHPRAGQPWPCPPSRALSPLPALLRLAPGRAATRTIPDDDLFFAAALLRFRHPSPPGNQ